MSSSADDGGVKEFANASTSSMNLTRGIPLSFSPSVMESKLISSTAVVPLLSEATFKGSSVDMLMEEFNESLRFVVSHRIYF